MADILFFDRHTQQIEKEKIYGKIFIEILYGRRWFSKILSPFLLPLTAKIPFFSRLFGSLQKTRLSRLKIKPFIKHFAIDHREFLENPDSYQSFNDFFIRKLKPEKRPIITDPSVAILPADGRYLVYPDLMKADGFVVKGKYFDLKRLLNRDALFEKYRSGSLLIARLCPVDYHRFHFPCDCMPSKAELLNGPLYSVNPIALKKNITILSENKRMLTQLKTKHFGDILFIEVGATYVGSIHQTYQPNQSCKKGDEKGFFEFGGSCLLLLFEKGRIEFDRDLIEHSAEKREVRANFGQSLGKSGSLL